MESDRIEPDDAIREAAKQTAAITGDDVDDLARRAAAIDLVPADPDEGPTDAADQ